MRRFFSLVGAFSLVLSASWSSPAEPNATEAAIRKALDENTTFEFVEAPLNEVAEFIAKKHNIQVVLDRKALDDAGVGIDTPITRSLRNISLRSALKLTLKELDLTWVIAEEVLQIMPVDEAGQRLTTVVYDVTDLVSVEGGTDFDTLIDTITSTIFPTTWDSVGGPSSIAPFPVPPAQALVISQTQEVHDMLTKFFADLRSVRTARTDKEAPKANQKAAVEPVDFNAVVVKIYKVAVPLVQHTPQASGADKPKEALSQTAGTIVTAPDERYLGELSRAIPALVRPESWEKAGGQGVLFALPADASGTGHLLVRQTGEVHAQLQRFLSELQSRSAGQGGFGGGGGFF